MIDPRAIRAVIFDIGGTLLEFARPESRAHLRQGIRLAYEFLLARQFSLPPLARYRRRVEWCFLRGWMRSLLRGREMNPLVQIAAIHRPWAVPPDAALVAEIGRHLYLPIHDLAHAAAGAIPTLTELGRRGYRLALISNTLAPPPALDDHLADEGLLPFFPIRIFSCALGVRKPHPRIFLTALQRLDVPAGQAVYVGNNPRQDVGGARRVGMGAVLLASSGRSPWWAPRPDFVIRQLPDLAEILPPRVASCPAS